MHARVTTITASADRAEQGIAQFREDVVPFVREHGGRGAIMLVDRASGRAMAITLWDDEDAMRRSEEAAAGLRREAAEAGGAQEAPRVETYEVSVFETS